MAYQDHHYRAALAVDESSTFAPFLEAAGIKPEAPAAKSEAPVQLVSAKQDYKQLTFNQSCHLLAPIQIGEEHFAMDLVYNGTGTLYRSSPREPAAERYEAHCQTVPSGT